MSKNILLIDDDILVLRTLAKYLKACGYLVVTVSNGSDALEKVESSKFDLIISDIRMPGMSGIEALRKIRDQVNNDKNTTPAIVITGYAGDESYAQDESLGITDYLYKPFEIDEFLKIVKKNLEPIPTYKRIHPRITVSFPLKLIFKELKSGLPFEVTGETLTLSEGGLSMTTTHEISIDSRAKVHINPSPVYASFYADVRIVWAKMNELEQKYYYGLVFSKIEEEQKSSLIGILNKYKSLSEQFVYLTKKLQQFVQDLKYKLDYFDKACLDEQKRIKFLLGHKEKIFSELTDYFVCIWEIVKDFDKDRYIIHKDFYQKSLGSLLLDPIEVNRRIYQKPLGYPGDYIIMNYIYDYNGEKSYLGGSTFEKLINNYTCNIPVSCANVARKNFLKNTILKLINDVVTPRITSIGCGSARELLELLGEDKVNKKTFYQCLDLEREALRYIKEAIDIIPGSKTHLLEIKYIHRDITSIIRDKKLKDLIKGSDLTYLSGVYDYLSNKMAKRLTSELFSLLGDKGKLIICNISLENSSHRAYYELLGEWNMVHRAKEEMLDWTKELSRAEAEFVYPPNGSNYHFLAITKS